MSVVEALNVKKGLSYWLLCWGGGGGGGRGGGPVQNKHKAIIAKLAQFVH